MLLIGDCPSEKHTGKGNAHYLVDWEWARVLKTAGKATFKHLLLHAERQLSWSSQRSQDRVVQLQTSALEFTNDLDLSPSENRPLQSQTDAFQ